jgi:DNA-directed RNA polymerase subunit E'/Rpb7
MSFTQEVTETIHLPISDVYSEVPLDQVILEHLQRTKEGVCTQYGYVYPESVALVQKTLGTIVTVDTQSLVEFRVTYRLNTLKPCQGDIFDCILSSQTKMGLMGFMKHGTATEPHQSPLLIIIPDKTLDPQTTYAVGKTYQVEILECRIKYKSPQIQSAAKIV